MSGKYLFTTQDVVRAGHLAMVGIRDSRITGAGVGVGVILESLKGRGRVVSSQKSSRGEGEGGEADEEVAKLDIGWSMHAWELHM